MFRAAALIAVLVAGPALADSKPAPGEPPQRVRSITLTKPDEKCPESTGNEVVVCQRLDEPYRLPKQFRTDLSKKPAQSWAVRSQTMDATGREAAGLPDTCSPVGTGGQTGCTQQFMQRAAAERAAKARR